MSLLRRICFRRKEGRKDTYFSKEGYSRRISTEGQRSTTTPEKRKLEWTLCRIDSKCASLAKVRANCIIKSLFKKVAQAIQYLLISITTFSYQYYKISCVKMICRTFSYILAGIYFALHIRTNCLFFPP